MEDNQERTIKFTCTNCKQESFYSIILIPESKKEGAESQIFRCKTCGIENSVKMRGFRFPNTTTILRGE